MARGFSLPDSLPLFPLSGAVLLPRGHLPLHIFEPRYLQMIEDVLKTSDRMIGMIQPLGDGLAQVGTGGRIVAFSEEDDGRLMISLRAVSRFHLTEAQEGFAPYLRGRVDWSGFDADKGPEEEDRNFDREPFLKRLGRYMTSHDLTTDWGSLGEAGDEVLINALSQLLPLQPEEKQALLEAATLTERRILLAGLIEYDLHSAKDPDDGEEILQ